MSNTCKVKASNLASREHALFFDRKAFSKSKVLEKVIDVAPKCVEILKRINSLPGKHVIYSSDTVFLKFLVGYFMSEKLTGLYDEKLKIKDSADFALLTNGSVYGKNFPVALKNGILSKFNERPGNIDSSLCRILLITSAYREGISLFDVDHIHIIEPPTTETQMTQIVGRATRMCGHIGREFVPDIGWTLNVFIYDVKNGGDSLTGLLTERSVIREYLTDIAIDKHLTAPYNLGPVNYPRGYYKDNATGISLIAMLTVAMSNDVRFSPMNKKESVVEFKKRLEGVLLKALGTQMYVQEVSSAEFNLLGYIKRRKGSLSKNISKLPQQVPKFIVEQYNRDIKDAIPISTREIPVQDFSSAEEAQDHVERHFAEFTWDTQPLVNRCIREENSPAITPHNTQMFVKNYFVPSCPFKGFICYHSVGSGKTVTGSLVSDTFYDADYDIIWVTRSSLKRGVDPEMNKVVPGLTVPVMSFKQLSNGLKGKNKLFDKSEDPLAKTLLVIDEVHLLFDGSLPAQERSDNMALIKGIQKSYDVSGENSVRILAMSGTLDESNIVYKGVKELCGDHGFGNLSFLDATTDPRKFAVVNYTTVDVNIEGEYFSQSEKVEMKVLIDKLKETKKTLKNDMDIDDKINKLSETKTRLGKKKDTKAERDSITSEISRLKEDKKYFISKEKKRIDEDILILKENLKKKGSPVMESLRKCEKE